MRNLLNGALPASVALAAIVLVLTAAGHLVGPALLRAHANGLAIALLGMGVSMRWSLAPGAVKGTVSPGAFPALLAASVVILVALALVGWTAARRRPESSCERAVAPAAIWFAALCAIGALVISHSRALAIGAARIDLGFSTPAAFMAGAVWGLVSMSAGALVARVTGSPRLAPRRAWLVKAPGAFAVISAVTIVGASACGSLPNPTRAAAASPRTSKADPTTTTTVPPTSTTTTAAATSNPVAASATSAAHGTTSRASRSAASGTGSATTGVGTGGTNATSSGWAPAAPGIYRYSTSGSTSSLLGNKSFPSVTTLKVDHASGTQQHSLRALESSNGDGFVIDQVLDYQAQGVAVVQQRLSLTQSGNKTVRTLHATGSPLIIPLSTAIGTHREFDLTGSSISGHETVDIAQAGSVVVGGQSVAAVLVKTVLTISGNVTGTIQLDQWWAPSVRVPPKEHVSGTMKSGLVTVRTNYDATLQSLSPA